MSEIMASGTCREGARGVMQFDIMTPVSGAIAPAMMHLREALANPILSVPI